jgi:hypothetical protein
MKINTENYDAGLEIIYKAINDLKTLDELKSLFNTIVSDLESDETIIGLIRSIQNNLLKEQGLNIWGRGNGNLGAFLSFLKIRQHEIQLKRKKQFSNNKNQLKTNLTDPQRGKLFDLLVKNGFITDKDRDGFIWAFGGVNDKFTSYSTEWLKAKNLAVYLIDKLCYDPTNSIHYWAIGTRIFGIKKMAQIKQGYFSINQTSKPKGFNLIDTIISEAQK